VYEPAIAGFSATPLSGTRPLTVTFTNQSTGDFDQVLWNFGDGVTSTLFSLTHTYHLARTYTVTLQVSGLGGTDDLTRENYITVYEPVSVDFTATPISGTRPLTVTFTNQSLGDFDQVLWDFGDGVTDTTFNPTHTYNPSGSFTVTLAVNGSGGAATLMRTNYITVYTPASADFTATPISGVRPLTVTFTNQSAGDFIAAMWDFGDGVTSTTFNPSHTYQLSGTYTVTLQVSGSGGTSNRTRGGYIIVLDPPVWKFYLPLVIKSP
jgi:PKD repeat protein